MTTDEVFQSIGEAYLCLIRPTMQHNLYRQELAPIVAIASHVPDEIVASMITDGGWREHVVGFVIAMAKDPAKFASHVVASLKKPCGLAITPACAFLTTLARSGEFEMPSFTPEGFDLRAFDGEMGWAIHKARHHSGLCADDAGDRGPYYG
jgi:hypothetical protein